MQKSPSQVNKVHNSLIGGGLCQINILEQAIKTLIFHRLTLQCYLDK